MQTKQLRRIFRAPHELVLPLNRESLGGVVSPGEGKQDRHSVSSDVESWGGYFA